MMQAPSLLPPGGLSGVNVEQLRQQQQQQQHCGMSSSSQGSTQQQSHQQLQLLQLQEQQRHRLLQGAHPLQPQQQEPGTQQNHLQSAGQQHLPLQHQMQQQQHHLQQHRQLQMPGTAGLPKILPAFAGPEHVAQYPHLFRTEQLPAAGSSRTTRSIAPQQQFYANNNNSWAPSGAPRPSTAPGLQHQQRMTHQALFQQQQQQPELQQQETKQHQQEKQQNQREQQQQPQQRQQQQLSQQQLTRERLVSGKGLREGTGEALLQQQNQVTNGSAYDAGSATPYEQQQQRLNLQEQRGTEDKPRNNASSHALQDMKPHQQQPQLPATSAAEKQLDKSQEAAAGVAVSTLSDSGNSRNVPQPTKQQEKKTNACKGSQKASSRVTASGGGCHANASQKTSCFEILYQDALHRRTRQLRAELGRDRVGRRSADAAHSSTGGGGGAAAAAATTGTRQTCTPQQWEQRWNLMIKRHQEKISFNEALKRKLEVSKREDEGRECTFKPVTWSLRKPLVQQKRRLLKLEALAEQQQVLKEALFVLQYEEKQMDEYIAMKLQQDVHRASTEEKSDEELKNILDFYRDRKLEETNRHRSMKLDLLTQLTRLDQQYKRTAASGNLQDGEAAEAVGFDLSLSDKIREDIMEELDSLNSLRSGAKFRAIWEASLPVYGNNCYPMDELQSNNGTAADFTLLGGGYPAAVSVARGSGQGAAAEGRMSLARRRHQQQEGRGGGGGDKYPLKSSCDYQRGRRCSNNSSSSSRSGSTVTGGRPLSRNRCSPSPSSSSLSKSRRGSDYSAIAAAAATARDQQGTRVKLYNASPPLSPHIDASHNALYDDYVTQTQLDGRSLALQQQEEEEDIHDNEVDTQLLMEQDGSLLRLQQQRLNAMQQQQLGGGLLQQQKKAQEEEEQQQQRGMQQGFVTAETHMRENHGQRKMAIGAKNITTARYGAGLSSSRSIAVASNASGRPVQRGTVRENFNQTLPSTGNVRASIQQQRGWQPHPLSINRSPQLQPRSAEIQQQPRQTHRLSPVAGGAAAQQSSLQRQQQLSGATHVVATSPERRNSMAGLHNGAGGQQQVAAASPRASAVYAGQQPNRAANLQVSEKSLQQQVANRQQQQPFMPAMPQQQQHGCGYYMYPSPHGNAQPQQMQMHKQQGLISQQIQWQGSAAAASKAPPPQQQQVTPQGVGAVAEPQQQSFTYRGGHPFAFLPSVSSSSSMETLQGLPPVQTNPQQAVLQTGRRSSSGRSAALVAEQQALQQQQTARQQQEVGKHHHQAVVAQQQQPATTSAQPYIGQTMPVVLPSGAPASCQAPPLSAGVNNASPPQLSPPCVTTSHQTPSPRVAQTSSAFVSTQPKNQTHRVSAGAVAAGGRGAGAERSETAAAGEQRVESWSSSSFRTSHGQAPTAAAASQLQQLQLQQPKQQKANERGFALPSAATASLQPRNGSVMKNNGSAFVHMPPFPAAGGGGAFVDFAAAAKLCQRGNMLFAAR